MSKLAEACELSFNEWLETFPEVIPEAECSKKHEKWKKKLFNKMRNDRYHMFTTNTVRVILIAAILSALLLSAFVFPSSRESLLDNSNIYSKFKITEHNKNSVNREIKVGYIPEGFEFDNLEKYSKYVVFKYHSGKDDFFTIWKCSSSLEMEFNTEFFELEEIIVNNIKYTYCQGNEGVNNLVWTKNDYVYRIDGTLLKEELLEIAKTVV